MTYAYRHRYLADRGTGELRRRLSRRLALRGLRIVRIGSVLTGPIADVVNIAPPAAAIAPLSSHSLRRVVSDDCAGSPHTDESPR